MNGKGKEVEEQTDGEKTVCIADGPGARAGKIGLFLKSFTHFVTFLLKKTKNEKQKKSKKQIF